MPSPAEFRDVDSGTRVRGHEIYHVFMIGEIDVEVLERDADGRLMRFRVNGCTFERVPSNANEAGEPSL